MLTSTAMARDVVAGISGGVSENNAPKWVIEKCRIQAQEDILTLKTNGISENKQLLMRMVFSRPLNKLPSVTLNNDEHQVLEVEGYGKVYNFLLDYNPVSISRMLPEGAGFIVSFSPVEWDQKTDEVLPADTSYNLVIPTAGFAEKVAEKAALPEC